MTDNTEDSNKKTQLATLDTVSNRFLAAADQAGGGDFGPLMKFSKGRYYIGDVEVPTGTEYVAQMEGVSHGWIKFVDAKVVEQKVGRIADGFIAPKREELGDTDESLWERDNRGEPRNPWSFQYYVPLIHNETGELVVFVTGSRGGKKTVGSLLRIVGHNTKRGNPTVRLEVSSYKHKTFGRIEEPDIKVVGWESAAPAIAMSDSIPF
jgi:hypothetical protein